MLQTVRKPGQLQQSGCAAGAGREDLTGQGKGSGPSSECTCFWHLWGPWQECKRRLRHHIFKYLKWLHKNVLFYSEEQTIKIAMMAKHKISILEFHCKVAGAHPGCCPPGLLSTPFSHHCPPGTTKNLVCARVQGKRSTQAPSRLKGSGWGITHYPKWWQHRFLKGTIPLGLTGEEGIQPEASQKRVFLNGWGQGQV